MREYLRRLSVKINTEFKKILNPEVMCIFCKSNDLIKTFFIENIHKRYKIIECKFCNSEIYSNENNIAVRKYPNNGNNYLKYNRIISGSLITVVFLVIILFVLHPYIDKEALIKLICIAVTTPILIYSFWSAENIYNFIKNGYMIVPYNHIITKNNGKNECIFYLIFNLFLSIGEAVLYLNAFYILVLK